jgi:hypothetical protein
VRYVIIDVGCLECRAPTVLVGTSNDLPAGVKLITREGEVGDSGWEGEHVLAAIDMEAL